MKISVNQRGGVFLWKLMNLERLRAGKVDELRSRFAVDIDLPIDGAQRCEVIAYASFDPRQAHAAVNLAGFAFVQEAATVVEVDLRQHFKCISLNAKTRSSAKFPHRIGLFI